MGVYIKGMEMPTEAEEARRIILFADGNAETMDRKQFEAVELPPHGDLIDRDAVIEAHVEAERGRYGGLFVVGDNRFMKRFVDAPIIIPADKEATP